MRDIKFRGKRVDNGEWVYGNLLILSTCDERKRIEHIIVPISYDKNDCYSPTENDDLCFETFYKVIPESVDQYTGVKDKGKIEIYEGDLITIGYSKPSKIIFQNGMFGAKNDLGFMTLEHQEAMFEIIGNITDNPELLAKK